MKVSFDFDKTLATKKIQIVAKNFVDKGHDVYVTTSRHQISPFYNNTKVYDIAESVGIPANKVRFTDGRDKYLFLKDFDIHFDDDSYEIDLINVMTKCVGILVDK
jgi:hypothetical protein